jgi:hypothetical protein
MDILKDPIPPMQAIHSKHFSKIFERQYKSNKFKPKMKKHHFYTKSKLIGFTKTSTPPPPTLNQSIKVKVFQKKMKSYSYQLS